MRYSIFLITLGLIGCGGGGGGGSSAPAPAPTQETDTSDDATQTEEEDKAVVSEVLMTDLSVPNDVDYNPTQEYTVSIDISGNSTDRAFASIYSNYEALGDGSYKAGYASKVGSVSLSQGLGELSIVSAEHQSNLLVEIWFYDGSAPLQQLVSAASPKFTY